MSGGVLVRVVFVQMVFVRGGFCPTPIYILVPCAGRALGPSPAHRPLHNSAGRAWAYILRPGNNLNTSGLGRA